MLVQPFNSRGLKEKLVMGGNVLGNRLKYISGCHILCLGSTYFFGGGGGWELNFHVKCIVGYKLCTGHL